MALNDFNLFSWKSREAQQKEQTEYARWAFPYGQQQRDELEKLMRSLYPKESIPSMLVPFLTCKELYEGYLKSTGSSEEAIKTLLNKTRKHKHLVKKKNLTTYAALVLADAVSDSQCTYPSADEIRAWAQELEKLRNDI